MCDSGTNLVLFLIEYLDPNLCVGSGSNRVFEKLEIYQHSCYWRCECEWLMLGRMFPLSSHQAKFMVVKEAIWLRENPCFSDI